MSNTAWIVIGLVAAASFIGLAYGIVKAHQQWGAKGKGAFYTTRRRTSLETSTQDLQLAGMEVGLAKFRAGYPDVTEKTQTRGK
jgi:hypothetical protein